MLYNALRKYRTERGDTLTTTTEVEAWARHAFTLAGYLPPLAPRPEFDQLFDDWYRPVPISMGKHILEHLLDKGVMLGERGGAERPDRHAGTILA